MLLLQVAEAVAERWRGEGGGGRGDAEAAPI